MAIENKRVSSFGISALSKYFDTLTAPEMPAIQGNKIVTLNKQGFMRVELDPYSEEWIEDASKSKLPFLELGAAYGEPSITAVRKGATIIANDISLEHLTILRSRLEPQYHNNLYLNHSNFPYETDFPQNSLGGVLFCRLGHFFTNEQMRAGLQKIHRWLAPEGKLYFVSVSPYHYTLREEVLPNFLLKKEINDPNPGYIENMQKFIAKSAENVPKFMNCFDEYTISKLVEGAGLLIEKVSLFDYSTNNSQDKGFVGLIASKHPKIAQNH